MSSPNKHDTNKHIQDGEESESPKSSASNFLLKPAEKVTYSEIVKGKSVQLPKTETVSRVVKYVFAPETEITENLPSSNGSTSSVPSKDQANSKPAYASSSSSNVIKTGSNEAMRFGIDGKPERLFFTGVAPMEGRRGKMEDLISKKIREFDAVQAERAKEANTEDRYKNGYGYTRSRKSDFTAHFNRPGTASGIVRDMDYPNPDQASIGTSTSTVNRTGSDAVMVVGIDGKPERLFFGGFAPTEGRRGNMDQLVSSKVREFNAYQPGRSNETNNIDNGFRSGFSYYGRNRKSDFTRFNNSSSTASNQVQHDLGSVVRDVGFTDPDAYYMRVKVDKSILKVTGFPSEASYSDLAALFPNAHSITFPLSEPRTYPVEVPDLYCYVLFHTQSEAEMGMRHHGSLFMGRRLKITYRTYMI